MQILFRDSKGNFVLQFFKLFGELDMWFQIPTDTKHHQYKGQATSTFKT